jgi:hypothetical protein
MMKQKEISFDVLPNDAIVHARGCGISYLQRNTKIPYSAVPKDSWFLKEKLCNKISIDIPWCLLEPKEGQFVWEHPEWEGCFDSWIKAGYKVHLKVRGMDTRGTFYGLGTPQWVFDAGAKYVDESVENYRHNPLMNPIPADMTLPVRFPVYWDPIYLEKVANFVRVFGRRYNGRPEVESVSIAHMGHYGEMHVAGHGSNDLWMAAGFSLDRYLGAQRKIIDMYLEAFPDTPLSQSIGPPIFEVEGINVESAAEIYAYLAEKGVMLKYDGLGKSWEPGSNPYLCRSVVEVMERHWRQTKIAFENLALPEAIEEGLRHHLSYWNRGGEIGGLAEMRVAEFGSWEQKKGIYSFYSFFSDACEAMTPEDEKNIWRTMARKCGYRLSLEKLVIRGDLNVGKSFSTRFRWRNSGGASCYESFDVELSLYDSARGKNVWLDCHEPTVGCSPRVWLPGVIEDDLAWHLPSDVPAGKYELRVRLMLKKYYKGDWIRLANQNIQQDGHLNCGECHL